MVSAKKTLSGSKKQKGMTLVEVMVATIIFVIIAIGTSTAIIQGYRLSIQVRYQDRAMNGLKAIADQFQHSILYTVTKPSALTPNPARKDLLSVTTAPTGLGLAWNKALDTYASSNAADVTNSPAAYYVGTASGLVVYFGADAANGVTGTPVTFTRDVSALVVEDGADRILKGTFKATFTLLGKPTSLSVTAIRNLCPTDLK